jgi:hypothetical protein
MGADSAITLDGQSRVAMGITTYVLPRRANPSAQTKAPALRTSGLMVAVRRRGRGPAQNFLLTISHHNLYVAGRGAPQLDGSSALVSM